MNPQKKTIKDRVCDLLILSSEPMTVPQIVARLQVEADSVYVAIRKMTASREVSVHQVDGATRAYGWLGKTKPVRTPGRRVDVMSGDYLGLELRPFEGRPGCNQHEQCPSRMGDRLILRSKTTDSQ